MARRQISITARPTEPIPPLDDYEQKVRASAARGAVYPYELIGLLIGTAGTFFELDPPTNGGNTWTETVLHSFGPTSSNDGLQPASAPLRIGKHFYGTTRYGGPDSSCYAGCGTVYEITP